MCLGEAGGGGFRRHNSVLREFRVGTGLCEEGRRLWSEARVEWVGDLLTLEISGTVYVCV